MSDNKQYVGVTSKSLEGENVKSIYPDGTFNIFNSNGKLGMVTVGTPADSAMGIKSIQVFASLSEAIAWVQVPNSN